MVQKVTNAFDTYTAKGNREDLIDAIFNIDPDDTPFLSGIPRVGATATNHEWQTDSLASPDGANAQLEGKQTERRAVTPTTRLSNINQISDKDATITGTQQIVQKAGRASEMGYQMAKKTQELRRDMETIATANQAKNAGNATTARTTATISSWLGTNTSFGATGADPVTLDGAATRTDGTQRAFTEDLLKPVIQSVYNSGGRLDMLMVGPFNKTVASGFTGRSQARQQVSPDTILAAASIYASDFGDLTIVPNRFQRERDGFVLQMDMWALAMLRDFVDFELGKVGDAETQVVLSEWCLEARNEAASGAIFDLNTA